MISRSDIKNPTDAAGYYTREQAAAEYYSGEHVPSAWRGKAAGIMGLRGRVDHAQLTAVLKGQIADATGPRQLGTMRGGQHQHRAGWDFTISAPKSVSLQALVFDDKRALEAHRTAVNAALDYLERHGAVYRPRSGEYARGAGLAIATFEHVSSRAKDPQLHTHALIANLTIDPQTGRAYSLSNEQLFTSRRAADAVYHATLAAELQKAGYAVRFDKDGRVEIDHFSPENLRDFSTRANEIEAALAKRGQTRAGSTAEQRQVLALDTRAGKDLPETRAAHAARWQAQAEALGITPAPRQIRAPQIMPAAISGALSAQDAVDKAVSHLTEREAIFSRADLHREALRFAEGRADITAIEQEIAARKKAGHLLRADDGQRGPRYTTAQALAEEQDTDRRLQAGRGAHHAVMSDGEFAAALARFEARKGFALSDEQRAAARLILVGGDRYQSIQGLAGTGKTTLLAFVREAAQSKGWQVTGHSNGAEQAATMQRESGIATTTTAQYLINARRDLATQGRDLDTKAAPRRVLCIMDEASMAGAAAFRDVVRATEATGARAVFLGDSRQHQSVERGRAFERAQANIPTATLGEKSIRRQKTQELKAAVAQILARREAAALARLRTVEVAPARQEAAARGASREELRAAARQDNAAVVQRIARDYAALPADRRAATLVLTSTNSDRVALNAAIRQELQRTGQLQADAAQARILRAADMTKEDAKRAASYTPGQIVEVTTGRGAERQVSRYVVERVDTRTNTLHVRGQDGSRRVLDPSARGQRIQAYDTEQRGIAPGDRLRFTENQVLDGQKVRNGQVATVERVDGQAATLCIGDGDKAQRVIMDMSALKADYDYAVTSYSSQGRTVDAVLIHHNTETAGHNSRETYVNVTRAREDVTLYTQDAEKMLRQAGIEQSKTAAHDLVQQRGPEMAL